MQIRREAKNREKKLHQVFSQLRRDLRAAQLFKTICSAACDTFHVRSLVRSLEFVWGLKRQINPMTAVVSRCTILAREPIKYIESLSLFANIIITT